MTEDENKIINDLKDEYKQIDNLKNHFMTTYHSIPMIFSKFKGSYRDYQGSEEDNRKLFGLSEDFTAYLMLCLEKRKLGIMQQIKLIENNKQEVKSDDKPKKKKRKRKFKKKTNKNKSQGKV